HYDRGMRTMFALALVCGSLLLAGDPNINADVSVKAGSVVRKGPVHELRGDAVLETSAVQIKAESIDYNQETNEIEAHGNVHVKLKGNPSYLFVDGRKERIPNPPPTALRRRDPGVVEIIK